MSQKGFTYHWLIVIACFLLTAVSIGITVNCFAVFTVELKNIVAAELAKDVSLSPEDLKIAESNIPFRVQLIFTIAGLAYLIGSALIGKVIAKFSMHRAMMVYAIIMAAGLYLWSHCGATLEMYYIVAPLVGFGASGIALIPCGVLINNWFEENKGLATGLAFTGSVAGGMILTLLTQYVLDTYNIETAYLTLAIICAVVAIPTTIFIAREHPKDKGLMPYGAKEQTVKADQIALKGITLKTYIKTSSFWLLAISVFIISFINVGLQNNLNFYMTDIGHSAKIAAYILAVYFMVNMLGKLILGFIYDKKGIGFGTIYIVVAWLATASLLLYSGIYSGKLDGDPDTAMGIAFACGAVFGLVGSMTTVTPPYVTARIVGLKDYATILGILNLFYGIGLVVGPLIPAKIFNKTGSYTNAWILFGTLAVILGITTILSAKKGKGFSELA